MVNRHLLSDIIYCPPHKEGRIQTLILHGGVKLCVKHGEMISSLHSLLIWCFNCCFETLKRSFNTLSALYGSKSGSLNIACISCGNACYYLFMITLSFPAKCSSLNIDILGLDLCGTKDCKYHIENCITKA